MVMTNSENHLLSGTVWKKNAGLLRGWRERSVTVTRDGYLRYKKKMDNPKTKELDLVKFDISQNVAVVGGYYAFEIKRDQLHIYLGFANEKDASHWLELILEAADENAAGRRTWIAQLGKVLTLPVSQRWTLLNNMPERDWNKEWRYCMSQWNRNDGTFQARKRRLKRLYNIWLQFHLYAEIVAEVYLPSMTQHEQDETTQVQEPNTQSNHIKDILFRSVRLRFGSATWHGEKQMKKEIALLARFKGLLERYLYSGPSPTNVDGINAQQEVVSKAEAWKKIIQFPLLAAFSIEGVPIIASAELIRLDSSVDSLDPRQMESLQRDLNNAGLSSSLPFASIPELLVRKMPRTEEVEIVGANHVYQDILSSSLRHYQAYGVFIRPGTAVTFNTSQSDAPGIVFLSASNIQSLQNDSIVGKVQRIPYLDMEYFQVEENDGDAQESIENVRAENFLQPHGGKGTGFDRKGRRNSFRTLTSDLRGTVVVGVNSTSSKLSLNLLEGFVRRRHNEIHGYLARIRTARNSSKIIHGVHNNMDHEGDSSMSQLEYAVKRVYVNHIQEVASRIYTLGDDPNLSTNTCTGSGTLSMEYVTATKRDLYITDGHHLRRVLHDQGINLRFLVVLFHFLSPTSQPGMRILVAAEIIAKITKQLLKYHQALAHPYRWQKRKRMLIQFIDSIIHGLHHDRKTKCRIKECYGDQFWLVDAPIWLALGSMGSSYGLLATCVGVGPIDPVGDVARYKGILKSRHRYTLLAAIFSNLQVHLTTRFLPSLSETRYVSLPFLRHEHDIQLSFELETFQDSRNFSMPSMSSMSSMSSASDLTDVSTAPMTQDRFQMFLPILLSNMNLFRLLFGSLKRTAPNQDDLVSPGAFFEALATRLTDTLILATSRYCKSGGRHLLTQGSQGSGMFRSVSIGSLSRTSSASNYSSAASSLYASNSIGGGDGSSRNNGRRFGHTFQLSKAIERQGEIQWVRNRLKKAAKAIEQGDNWKALESMDAAKECILNMRNYSSLFVPLEYRLALLLLRLLTSKESRSLQNAIGKLKKWLIYFYRPANIAGCLSNSSSHPLYGLLLKCSMPNSNGLDAILSRNIRDELVGLFEDVGNSSRTSDFRRSVSLYDQHFRSGIDSTSSSTALLFPSSNAQVHLGVGGDMMTISELHVNDFVVDLDEDDEGPKDVALQKATVSNLDEERSEMMKNLEKLCDMPWSEFSYQLPAFLFEDEDEVDGNNGATNQQYFLDGSSAFVAQGSVVAWGKPLGLSLDDEAKLQSSSPETNALISDMATNGSRSGSLARIIPFPLPLRSIQQVACGYRHTAFVTSGDRQLYTFGYGECGRLGHGDEVSQAEPTQVSFFSTNESLRVQYVSCGREHTMVVTVDGDLYGFGWAEAGRIGIEEIGSVVVPTKVENLTEKIKSVSCGREHTIALSRRGVIYAFGAGFGGRIGNGEEEDVELPVPISIRDPLDPTKEAEVVAVDAGECHSCALTSKGQVFTWGFGSSGALGSGARFNRLRPEPISRPIMTNQLGQRASHNDSIVFSSIACGSYHTLAATADGRVFGWGDTAGGQLGLVHYQASGTDLVILHPVQIELETNNVTQIACGTFTSAACTNDGKLFFWGSAAAGNGVPLDLKLAKPQEIGFLKGLDIGSIACGAYHAVAITKTIKYD